MERQVGVRYAKRNLISGVEYKLTEKQSVNIRGYLSGVGSGREIRPTALEAPEYCLCRHSPPPLI